MTRVTPQGAQRKEPLSWPIWRRSGAPAALAGCLALSIAGVSALAASAAAAYTPPAFFSNGQALGSTPRSFSAWGRITLQNTVLGKVNCVVLMDGSVWNAAGGRGAGEVGGFSTSDCEAPSAEPLFELERGCLREYECDEPLTVFLTAEMPLEKVARQAEICIVKTKTIEQCDAKNPEGEYTERETKLLTSEFHRGVASLPWKLELTEGEREEEEDVMQKIGLHEYGESGTAIAHSTKCYPKEGEKPASFQALPSGCIGIDMVIPQIPDEFVYYGTQEIFGENGVKNGLFPSRLDFIEAGTLFSSGGLNGEVWIAGEVKLDGSKALELITAR